MASNVAANVVPNQAPNVASIVAPTVDPDQALDDALNEALNNAINQATISRALNQAPNDNPNDNPNENPNENPNDSPNDSPDDNTNVDITLPEYVRAILPGGRNPTRLHLGMHVHDLRYTVIVEYNSDNLPLIALYDGPNTNGQLLGLVNKPRDSAVFWKHTNEITAVHMYQPNLSETFTMSSFMKPSYRFSTRVGLGEDEHYEKFQWRPTKGKEIEKFFMYPKGFKLVRQEAVGPSGGEGGSRKEREEGETSDGKEIVAVWVTENKLLPKVIDQECRAFKFELYGSAKTGELGHHLPYAALMSALKIWVDGN